MKFRYLLVLISLLALALFSSPVKAGGDVTVCDEANLRSALSGGGLVTFSCSGTITLTSPITINTDTTIDASGEDVTISGDGSYHVFYIGGGTITLRNLTVANGYGGPYTTGAGINNSGVLYLDGVTVANNGSGSGGGIANSGQITITNSTIQGNVSLSNGTGIGGNGAGIYNGGNGNIFISNSTFDSNYANGGGAIYNLSGAIDIVNSTFYENYVTSDGGAIYNSDNGTINIVNSTFSRNKAGQFSDGSGIYNNGNGIVTLTNSVIAYSQQGDSCYGFVTDGGGNLSYPDNSCPGINLDPVLGPLQDNGGPTMTTALLDGSSAIDNGINSVCNAAPVNGLDQRGVARPIGEGCDIGAYESDAMPPEPGFVVDVDPYYAAMCLTGSAMYNVDVLSVAGFDLPVTLGVNNLPSGTAATFDNNPVIPTASSELTISDTGTASVGSYTIDIVGTSITRTQTVSAYLYIYDTVPNIQPTLLTPPDNSTNTPLRPTFSWEPIQGAIYYLLEVATDSQFNNIVYSKTTLVTSDTPYNPLEEGTQYFWHIKASNNCGEGPFSETFTFTTMGAPAPDFLIDASPSSLAVCVNEDAIFDVNLTAVSGFDDPVTLSATGLPNEATATFDNNPVVPSGTSELTISDINAGSEGDYSIEIDGTSATQTHSTFVSLHVDPSAPDAAPILLTPTDGMTNTAVMPTFSWQSVPNATDYTLEISTDSGFNQIVYSTTVTQTSHTLVSSLNPDTEYYWRITPGNICGTGPVSAVYNFTTGASGNPFDYTIFAPIVMQNS